MPRGSDDDAIEDFDESPRPAKRRKRATKAAPKKPQVKKVPATKNIRPTGSTTSPSINDFDSDDESAFEVLRPTKARTKIRQTTASEDDDDALPTKPKHRIHVPNHSENMTDVFVTQASPSSSPNRVRGPIWLKKSLDRPAPAQQAPVNNPRLPPSRPSIASREQTHPTSASKSVHTELQVQNHSRRSDQSRLDATGISDGTTSPKSTGRNARNVAQHPNGYPATGPAFDLSTELADLPSDAFSFSSPERSPGKPIYISSQTGPVAQRQPNLRGPQSGLKQTTLFGSVAPKPTQSKEKAAVRTNTGRTEKENATTKKHAWPMTTKPEVLTHHKLDSEALSTWVYPVNLGKIRDYQFNIVSSGLFHNLLVALPTGLGKTFIAATVMLNWFRWTTEAQIVFLAPTKPLVAQQVEACFGICGIPRSQTVMLTGGISPGLRAEEWLSKRVFFMTPQTMINDLKTGICDPKRIVLVVVDEAHRATGSYAYVEVVKFIRRFNQSFRVLALTATPGSKVETVQQVIDGLDISRIEIRTEQSLDIRQYVHTREVETYVFDYCPEQEMVMELFSKAIKPVLDKLNGQNAYWLKDPMKLTPFGLTSAMRDWGKSEAGRNAPYPLKSMVHTIFTILASLAHSINMLKFHGIGPFFRGIINFKQTVDGGETKGKYATQIRNDENFTKMFNRVQGWINHPDFIGHPKLEHLRSVVLNHFLDAGEGEEGDRPPSATRVMVFAQFRDSAEEITRVLKRNSPMIRPHVFVGQADAKGSEGMGQKKQLEVIQQFKEGVFNTLIATSIGEEGLDIGEVDLIICYDANASPIRMLQRMGRTGRKRKGNIAILLMRDKEERDWLKAKDNYETMQAMIASGDRFTFHDELSPRILPKDIKPVVDKRVVEIPPENSQMELPEPKKKGKRAPKRPPKKFNMPDGVRTGFVTASRMDASDDEADEDLQPQSRKKATAKAAASRKTVREPTPEPHPAPLPFLDDVLLNKGQERELERKYQYVNEMDGTAVVMAPRADRYPGSFRDLGTTRYVGHGKAALRTAEMMKSLHSFDEESLQKLQSHADQSDLHDAAEYLIASPDQVRDPLPEQAMPTPQKTPARKKAAPRPAKKNKSPPAARAPRQAYRRSDAALEAESSSPEPTPANMRIATQGISLGSGDTSGEEMPDDELDSELAEFVVGSDAPIEYASSSMPQDAPRGRRPEDLFMSQESRISIVTDDSLPDVSFVVGRGSTQKDAVHVLSSQDRNVPVRRAKKRKVVMDDSDDE